MNTYTCYKLFYWSIVAMIWIHVVLSTNSATTQDYYSLLDIQRSANDKEIRRAFRKQAMQYHPDKNKEEGAEEKFREIAEAYEVLSDSEKRKNYNMLGHNRYVNGQNNGHNGFHASHTDINEMFKQFDFNDYDHEQFDNSDPFLQFDNDFINLDDLFGDNDDFGSHDSFFHGGHFKPHMEQHRAHVRRHQQRAQIHKQMHDAMFNDYERTERRECKTVTQKVGNMVTKYTTCT